MRRLPCPEGHYHLFPEAHIPHERIAKAPLPPLPFERNKEVDIARVARILDVSADAVERICKAKLLRAYQIKSTPKARGIWRIERASVVEYCDQLRTTYSIEPRRQQKDGFLPPDRAVLPFPADETISIEDVMEHLDVGKTTVRKLFDSGDLVAYKLLRDTPSPWRIHRPSFDAYLLKLRCEAEAKSPVTASAR